MPGGSPDWQYSTPSRSTGIRSGTRLTACSPEPAPILATLHRAFLEGSFVKRLERVHLRGLALLPIRLDQDLEPLRRALENGGPFSYARPSEAQVLESGKSRAAGRKLGTWSSANRYSDFPYLPPAGGDTSFL